MGGNNQTSNFLPRMIIRKPAESGTIPELPAMPPEYRYGGAWMDPQWKKNLNGYKKLFSVYPIQMAVILAVTVGLAIGLASLSSTACSGGSGDTETGSSCAGNGGYEIVDDPEIEDDDNDILGGETIELEDPDGLLGSSASGSVGDTSVTILGYKFAEDINGVDSIMVEYEVVNNGDESTYFYFLDHKAFQNGTQLINSFGKTDEYDNQEMILEILPGAVHRVHCLYNLISAVDPVEIQVSDMLQLSDDMVTATFELSGENIPAAVPEDSETPSVSSEADEGSIGDYYIRFISSETFEDDWGDMNIRVSFDFTNNSDDTTSAYEALGYYAFRGSTELSEDTFFFDDDYDMLCADVRPGETARVNLVFSDYEEGTGDIELTIYDYWNDEYSISFSFPVN